MATAKVTVNGTTILDLTDTTSVAANVAAGTKFYAADGTGTSGAATVRTSSDLQVWDDVVVVPAGIYSEQVEKSVGYTTVATPVATKGTVSNHAVAVTPSITQTAGYVDGVTKTGTAVTVSASELVSGNLPITANGNNIDVTNYATVSVSVPGGGPSMNAQAAQSTSRATSSTYTNCISLTCSVAGTYDVYWSTTRTSTSGTWGSQLYIGGTAYGTAQTSSWSNHVQNIHLTGVTIAKNQTVAVYARSRGNGYYTYVPLLTIIQTA